VAATHAGAADLQPLRYNDPDLVVDLGVGLWAWPIPCDADDDGDYDLLVSCPDKPSNGVWLFENTTGDTARDPLPVFAPARRLSPTVHYVMPSYVDGAVRVLSPGFEYRDFPHVGTAHPKPLPVPAKWYVPRGPQTKGPKVRHNQWRLVDYDADGRLDLVCGIEDWSFYGWDDAFDAEGRWTNGPLHATASPSTSRPAGRRWTSTAAPRPTSPTLTATATSTCSAVRSSIVLPTSRTRAAERRPAMPPASISSRPTAGRSAWTCR
jgi:hypothetical protein